MIYGLYLSASGGLAENARQQMNANNLANINTPGFKRQTMVFNERPRELDEDSMFPDAKDPIAEQVGGGTFVARTITQFSQGPIEATGNPLDVAIQGDGFFEVALSPAQRGYTRAGNFLRDNDGFLADQNGHQVLSVNGAPIPISEAARIAINSAGEVYDQQAGAVVATLAVRQFDDNTRLHNLGNNIYTTEQTPRQAPGATLVSQALEGSGSNAIMEMMNMINGFRAYEANMMMIRIQDANLQLAVDRVGRV